MMLLIAAPRNFVNEPFKDFFFHPGLLLPKRLIDLNLITHHICVKRFKWETGLQCFNTCHILGIKLSLWFRFFKNKTLVYN